MPLNKQFISILLAFSCCYSSAANLVETGPTGVGPLKLGLTYSEVMALEEANSLYVIKSETSAIDRKDEDSSKIEYAVTIAVANVPYPIESILTFENNVLTKIDMEFPETSGSQESLWKETLVARYGKGQYSVTSEKSSCSYVDGIASTPHLNKLTSWLTLVKDYQVAAYFRETSYVVCDESLQKQQAASMPMVTNRNLVIEKIIKKQP